MPSWDTPPPAAVAPIPVPVEPPAEQAEEQWGFDEAQIETAQRAATPPPAPIPSPSYAKKTRTGAPPRPVVKSGGGKRTAILIVLLLLAILGGGGYAGWMWWQKRQAAAEPQVAVARPVTPAVVQADAPAAPVETATSTTNTTDTTTTTNMATTTVVEQPNVTATAPPPAPPVTATTASVEPLPAVVPRPAAGGSRLEQMARDFAANPQGNFTVQIQILCDPSNVEQAMRQGGGQVWFVPQTIKGRSCYRVFYGRFATREEASSALARVPSALRDPQAAVKPVPR